MFFNRFLFLGKNSWKIERIEQTRNGIHTIADDASVHCRAYVGGYVSKILSWVSERVRAPGLWWALLLSLPLCYIRFFPQSVPHNGARSWDLLNRMQIPHTEQWASLGETARGWALAWEYASARVRDRCGSTLEKSQCLLCSRKKEEDPIPLYGELRSTSLIGVQ